MFSLKLPASFLTATATEYPEGEGNDSLCGCWFDGLEDTPLLLEDTLALAWSQWLTTLPDTVGAESLRVFLTTQLVPPLQVLRLRSEHVSCWLVLRPVEGWGAVTVGAEGPPP